MPRSTVALCGVGLALTARMVIAGADGGAAAPLAVAAFVAILTVTAWATGWRPGPIRARALSYGLFGALVLVAGPLGLRSAGGAAHVTLPLAQFPRWAVLVVAVAFSEELVLRGSLFDDLLDRWGAAAALGLTSVVFALIHLPLYGWRALPLDLAVGSLLGLLRLESRTVHAPAIAHALADLAAWWI